MTKRPIVRSRDECPCFSGMTFGTCCKGKIDWPSIIKHKQPYKDLISIRGRNIIFSHAIGEALQLDSVDSLTDLSQYKRAFTAEAVRKIYEAIVEIWPPHTDINYLLRRSASRVAGLYTGDYEADFLERAVVRHSLYADKILLVDPFSHPYVRSDQYNPILNPAQFRAQTLRDVNRFFRLAPWIDAGIVEFIRTPDDFDRDLAWQALEQAAAEKDDPEVRAILNRGVDQIKSRHRDTQFKDMFLLASPDSYLRKLYRDHGSESVSEDEWISYIHKRREENADFLETIDKSGSGGQLHIMTSGGTYDIAKLTAQISGAYLFTDLTSKWELIERDRNKTGTVEHWSPLAKSVGDAQLRFLDNVSLDTALRVRKDGLMRGLRASIVQAYRHGESTSPYSEERSVRFAQQLDEEVHKAEIEWEKLKGALVKLGAFESGLGVSAISLGQIGILEGAVGATIGVGAFAAIQHRLRRAYLLRHPTAVFMNI